MTKTESVHCYGCNGVGYARHINLLGIKKIKPCTRCKGMGKLYAEVGTPAWKKGKAIGAVGVGEYKSINEDRK